MLFQGKETRIRVISSQKSTYVTRLRYLYDIAYHGFMVEIKDYEVFSLQYQKTNP